jgi:hypothetical protein
MEFTVKDYLQVAMLPLVTGILIWNGFPIPLAIFLGFLSTFLPLVPGAIRKGCAAFREEWNHPRYRQ